MIDDGRASLMPMIEFIEVLSNSTVETLKSRIFYEGLSSDSAVATENSDIASSSAFVIFWDIPNFLRFSAVNTFWLSGSSF